MPPLPNFVWGRSKRALAMLREGAALPKQTRLVALGRLPQLCAGGGGRNHTSTSLVVMHVSNYGLGRFSLMACHLASSSGLFCWR